MPLSHLGPVRGVGFLVLQLVGRRGGVAGGVEEHPQPTDRIHRGGDVRILRHRPRGRGLAAVVQAPAEAFLRDGGGALSLRRAEGDRRRDVSRGRDGPTGRAIREGGRED